MCRRGRPIEACSVLSGRDQARLDESPVDRFASGHISTSPSCCIIAA
jgi:hypothetical protein